MSLRVTRGPDLSTRSVKVGDAVQVTMKVENSGTSDQSVSLWVSDLVEGALGKPVDFAFAFDPPAASVKAKGRASLAFTWRASLPEGKDAFTFRGKLALKTTTQGQLVAEAPLDLYVSRG